MIIKQIAERLGASYMYDDFGRINKRADSVKKWPLIAEVIPAEGQINTKFLPLCSITRNTIIAFLTPCPLDFDGESIEPQLEQMLDLCARFLSEYNAEGYDVPDTLQYNLVLDTMDANLCGVRVTLPKVDREGKCYGSLG